MTQKRIKENYLEIHRMDGKEDDVKKEKSLKINEKIINIKKTLNSLETSFDVVDGLQIKQWRSISSVKTINGKLVESLREAEKLNKTMLNLFRQNVTIDEFPHNIKRDIQKSWHQKYDALLKLSEQLRKQIHAKDILLKEKNRQIDILQQKLIDTGKNLVNQDESIQNLCKKYLALKKRKDEEIILLRGSIETLQESFNSKNLSNNEKKIPKMSLIPNNEALLVQEKRRSERLSRENHLLRSLIDEIRRKNIIYHNQISENSSDESRNAQKLLHQ